MTTENKEKPGPTPGSSEASKQHEQNKGGQQNQQTKDEQRDGRSR